MELQGVADTTFYSPAGAGEYSLEDDRVGKSVSNLENLHKSQAESSWESLDFEDSNGLRTTLTELRVQLRQSRNEVTRLNSIRSDIEAEVCQLTADLFQTVLAESLTFKETDWHLYDIFNITMRRLSLSVRELELEIDKYTSTVEIEAHTMVREANIKAAAAEKALKELQMKVEVLQAEVNALKTMLITSTPSRPSVTNPLSALQKSPSLAKQDLFALNATNQDRSLAEAEVDPSFLNRFVKWREDPQLSRNSSFMERMFLEDINPCLDFPNHEASLRVQQAVLDNSIFIEEITSTTSRCVLLDTNRLCRYRMKLNEENDWNLISQLCRNRITAVCNFLSYLRYIQFGLVKSSVEESYWHIMRLRKQMTLARLGLSE